MSDLISRKMAIETVSNMFAVTATQKDMVEDCLEILKNLPSLKFATDINVGCTIYRKAAIDTLTRLEPSFRGSVLEQALKNMPPAQPERKMGRWTVKRLYVQCYECGDCFPLIPQNYCPNCGADMRGEKE